MLRGRAVLLHIVVRGGAAIARAPCPMPMYRGFASSLPRRPLRLPHEVLQIPETAQLTQVKSAYYRLAIKLHPDVNKAASAHEDFIELGDAYRSMRERLESATVSPGGPDLRPNDAESRKQRRFLEELWEDHIQRSPLASKVDTWLFGHDDHTLVESLLRKGDLASALDILEDIKASGRKPTQSLFSMLIRGCAMGMRRPAKGTPLDERDHLTVNLHAKARELFLEMQVVHDLRPHHHTIHEMIRAHGKAGDYDSAYRLFIALIYEKHHRPNTLNINSMLEICAATGRHQEAFEFVAMLHGSRSLARALYRPDANTFALAMRNAMEGLAFDSVPEQLDMFASCFLKPTAATTERILNGALEAGQPAAAVAIAEKLKAIRVPVPEHMIPKLAAAREQMALPPNPDALVPTPSVNQSANRNSIRTTGVPRGGLGGIVDP